MLSVSTVQKKKKKKKKLKNILKIFSALKDCTSIPRSFHNCFIFWYFYTKLLITQLFKICARRLKIK